MNEDNVKEVISNKMEELEQDYHNTKNGNNRKVAHDKMKLLASILDELGFDSRAILKEVRNKVFKKLGLT